MQSEKKLYFLIGLSIALIILWRLLYIEQYRYGLPSGNNDPNVFARLRSAEINWIRGVGRRDIAVKAVKLTNGLDWPKYQTIWDFFYPTFDCPFTRERIGRLGDGGKWICGFENLLKKSNCIVYSFGVQKEVTFEKEILERTEHCKIFMYDISPGTAGPAMVTSYPNRVNFKQLGIGPSATNTMKTLKAIMAADGVQRIDILKMDIEGTEWKTMLQIIEDFPEELPFSQLQIEFHLNVNESGKWLEQVLNLYQKLEDAGLRSFYVEPNLYNGGNQFRYWEVAFLNTRAEPFKLR